MQKVQNTKLFQEDTGCTMPADSLVVSMDSESLACLAGANKVSVLDQRVKQNIKETIKPIQGISAYSPNTEVPTRKILTARRRLASKCLSTSTERGSITVPSTSNGLSEKERSAVESLTKWLPLARNRIQYEKELLSTYSLPSTEDKKKGRCQRQKQDGSRDSLISASENSESDEELKQLMATSQLYTQNDCKSLNRPKLTQLSRLQIVVTSSSEGEDADGQAILNYANRSKLMTNRSREFETQQQRLQTENNFLKLQMDFCNAKLATLQINLQQCKAELGILKGELGEQPSKDNGVSITDEVLHSTMVQAEAINERIDELEARLPAFEKNNSLAATSATATISQHYQVNQANSTGVATTPARRTINKHHKRRVKQVMQVDECQGDLQSQQSSQATSETSRQRCWCAAGQLKRELQIERALVKAWCTSSPVVNEIDLEAGHIPSKACESSLPRLSRTRDYWWTKELEDLRAASVRARKAYTRSQRLKRDDFNQAELYQAYQSAQKDLAKAIERAKQRGLGRPSS